MAPVPRASPSSPGLFQGLRQRHLCLRHAVIVPHWCDAGGALPPRFPGAAIVRQTTAHRITRAPSGMAHLKESVCRPALVGVACAQQPAERRHDAGLPGRALEQRGGQELKASGGRGGALRGRRAQRCVVPPPRRPPAAPRLRYAPRTSSSDAPGCRLSAANAAAGVSGCMPRGRASVL